MEKKNNLKQNAGAIYERYREVLGNPDLSMEAIDDMRELVHWLAQAICEHVWGRSFY